MLRLPRGAESYRRRQRYSVVGSLNQNASDPESLPVNLIYGTNCYYDQRVGAIRRRDGSLTETVDTGLGVPLGCGEWLDPSGGSAIPFTRTLLANFGGTAFYAKSAGAWASVTIDPDCNFGTGRPTQFAQLGTNLFIAGGTPARWGGGATDIVPVGIPPHNAAPGVVVNAGAGAFSATTGYSYMFCFYNSTTGIESDWSPVSSSTGAFAAKLRVEVTTPTTAPAAPGVDKKRIYRTLDGGSTYYLLATENLANATYNDTTADSALTVAAAPEGYKAQPPSTTYIVASYANRYWCVDADNPYVVRYSEAYTGSDVDIEYWPTYNYVIFNKPVTSLFVTPNRMLVFHARDISQVTGSSEANFSADSLLSGAGTLFPNSIVSDGGEVAFLSERGFVALGNGGVRTISREISKTIDPLLADDYNSSMFVHGAYHPAIRQFVWVISAVGTASAPWEVVGSGALGEWEDVTSGATEEWEDPGGGATNNTTRNIVLGWSPDSSREQNVWHDYTFAAFSDANATGSYCTYIFVPSVGETSLDPQQGVAYIGYYDGTEGQILGGFDSQHSLDDGVAFSAKFLTGRIDPAGDSGFKRFKAIGFPGAYADPTSDGLCTLKYLLDYDDPIYRGYEMSLITLSDNTDSKTLPQGKGRHLHLYGEDSSSNSSKVLLSEFFVYYRPSKQREGR